MDTIKDEQQEKDGNEVLMKEMVSQRMLDTLNINNDNGDGDAEMASSDKAQEKGVTSQRMPDTSNTDNRDGEMGNTVGKAQEKKAHIVAPIRNLYISAFAYNIFTITDGASRLIVLFYAADLGFTAWDIAIMFSFYEVCGIFTNLYAGVAGQVWGLKVVLLLSLMTQLISLTLLAVVPLIFGQLSVNMSIELRSNVTAFITFGYALGGVGKDLMKLVGKSVPKLVTKEGEEGRLFKFVTILTGSKNSFKGFGFFLGSLLVWGIGFQWSLFALIVLILIIIIPALLYMDRWLGRSPKGKRPKFVSLDVFKKGWNLNVLSLARFFLFGSRDVWFEIGAPLFLEQVLLWQTFSAGAFLAAYTIIYGNLQAYCSQIYKPMKNGREKRTCAERLTCRSVFNRVPNRFDVSVWAAATMIEVFLVGIGMYFTFLEYNQITRQGYTSVIGVMLAGLALYAILFAINSAIHSYLIVSYSERDKAAQDIGFYYMANAGGRLIGILVGGWLYTITVEIYGLSICIFAAGGFLALSTVVGLFLKQEKLETETPIAVNEQQNVVMIENMSNVVEVKESNEDNYQTKTKELIVV